MQQNDMHAMKKSSMSKLSMLKMNDNEKTEIDLTEKVINNLIIIKELCTKRTYPKTLNFD